MRRKVIGILAAVLLGASLQAGPGTVGNWEAAAGIEELDENGQPIWDFGMDLGIDSQGNVILATLAGQIVKYGPKGSVIWRKALNDSYEDYDKYGISGLDYILSGLAVGEDDEIYLVGYRGFNSQASAPGEEFVMRLDPSGDRVWYRRINLRTQKSYDTIYRTQQQLRDWYSEWPKVRVVPDGDTLIVSSGEFFNGDEGQYDYTQLSRDDGTILKRWHRGSVAGAFSVTSDGGYFLDADSDGVNFKAIGGEGSYILHYPGSGYFVGDQVVTAAGPGLFVAAGSAHHDEFRNGPFVAGGGLDKWGRFAIDWQKSWLRGYYITGDWDGPVYQTGRFDAAAVGGGGRIALAGWFDDLDLKNYWAGNPDACDTRGSDDVYSYLTVKGYLARLDAYGKIRDEAVYTNAHRDATFLATAIDGAGNVVAAGFRDDVKNIPFDEEKNCEAVWTVPFVVAGAMKRLPIYRKIRPDLQHRIHDPVDPASGNYVEQHIDLHYPTPGIPLALKRSYSSRFAAMKGSFGYGWSSSFDARIDPSADGTTLEVFWGDGHADRFALFRAQNGKGPRKTLSYLPVGGSVGYTIKETLNPKTGHRSFELYLPKLQRRILFDRHSGDGSYRPSAYYHGKNPHAAPVLTLDEKESVLTIRETASGKTLRLEKNEEGFVTRAQGPDGAVWRYGYDERGDLVSVTAPDGTQTLYRYDRRHHLLAIHQGSRTLLRNRYDAKGRVRFQIDAAGKGTLFAYDDAKHITRVTGSDDPRLSYRYDEAYRLLSVTDAEGKRKSFRYNRRGQLTSVHYPDGSTERYRYDAQGRLAAVTDRQGRKRAYRYDARGRLIRSTALRGPSVRLGYRKDGKLTSRTVAGEGNTTLGYDAQGRLVTVTDPLGARLRYRYTKAGFLSGTTGRDGVRSLYRRDAAGRVVQREYRAGSRRKRVRYRYDAMGRLLSASDARGTIAYGYTPRGYKGFEKGIYGKKVIYGYDAAGHLATIRAGALTLTTERDDAGRPLRVRDSFGHVLRYRYDASGRLREVEGPAGVAVRYRYDAESGRLSGIDYLDGEGEAFRRLDYGRDAGGRLTSVEDSAAPLIRRLPAAARLPAGPAGRLAKGRYDAAGRLLGFGDLNASYTLTGRPQRVTTAAAGSVAFDYDALGRRVRFRDGKRVRRIVYAGAAPLMELDAKGKASAYYLFGPGLSLVLSGDGKLKAILQSDARRNFLNLLDAEGKVVSERLYSPYGLLLAQSGRWSQPFGFLGESGIYSSRGGLVLTRARLYDPRSGRFLRPDPKRPEALVPESFKRYLYAYGDPVNLSDSSGRSPFPEGPRWLIPYVNAAPSLHPTQTLDGVAYPPMSAPASGAQLHPAAPTTLADATPIYSDRDSDNGGGNPQQAPAFNDASGLIASPIYSDRDSTVPPPTPQVAAAPGDGYVAGISTVPIIAVI